jgi:hypothetical protein
VGADIAGPAGDENALTHRVPKRAEILFEP